MNSRIWSISLALLAVVPALAQLQTLSYRPVDSIYSTQLDRLIMVNASPSQLHLYDPITRADTAVALQYPPTAVSLSMDGLYAAVGHDQWISWVDLRNASVVRTLNIGMTVGTLAVTAEYVYSFPPASGSPIRYIPIAGGASVASLDYFTSALIRPLARPVVARNGTSLYPSPGSFDRLDVGASGALQSVALTLSPAGLPDNCGAPFPVDSSRLLTRCGTVRGLTGSVSTDLEYHGALAGLLESASFSPGRNEFAAVLSDWFSISGKDTDVLLFRADYRSATGRFRLPPFSADGRSAAGRGRFIAWSADSSRLIVLQQADPSAGFARDFGVAVFGLRSDCAVTFPSPQSALAGTGGSGTVDVTTSGDCLWQAATSAPWLVLVDSGLGAGFTTLKYYAAPNPTAAPRSASISVGSQTWTITQAARSVSSEVTLLPFTPGPAGYSRQLDRLVMLSAAPNQLHVWDVASRTETLAVDLPAVPIALSISPDGQFAGVALQGAVLRVILANGAIDRRFDIRGSMVGAGLVLGSDSAWVLSQASGAARHLGLTIPVSQTPSSLLASTSRGVLSMDGSSLLLAGLRAQRLSAAEVPVVITDSSEATCGGVWPSLDGLRLFTSCGTVLRLSGTPGQDLTLAGRLSDALWGVAQIPSNGSVFALVPNPGSSVVTAVRRYLYDSLLLQESFPLPLMPDPSGVQVQSTGGGLFPSASGTQLHLILKGQQFGNSAASYGLYSLPVTGATPCAYTVAPRTISVGPASASIRVTVTTASACSWQAARDEASNWFSVVPESPAGAGIVTVYLSENTTGAVRTGTLTVAGQVVTVTQADSGGCWLRVPSEIVIPAPQGVVVVALEGPRSCSFPVRIPPGLAVTSRGSATGDSQHLFFIGNDGILNPPTATISIGPHQVNIVQIGSPCLPSIQVLPFSYLPAAGATGQVSLSFNGTCPATWSLAHAPSWLSIFPASGTTTGTQTITYTGYPNFSTTGRVGTLHFQGMLPVRVVQSESSLAADPRFVGRVYFASLGRTATTAETDFQVANALNKGVSRTDFALSFLSAPQFNAAARYVAGLYVGVLARDAEYAGWVFQRNALVTGAVNQLQLMANFLNSAEFQLKFGTLSNTEFVRLMYRNILLREAAPAEVTFQANALNTGTPRVNLASNFLNSAEFQQGTGSRLMAFLVYATLLGRDPSASELAQAVARLNAGTPVRTLINEIVEGYEFTDLVN